LTRVSTLSQKFDVGDFIAPNILSVVDASVRASADDIIDRSDLAGDIERIIDLRADVPGVSGTSFGGRIPSMNPDEFLSYEEPEAPVMAGFEEFDAERIIPDEPAYEVEQVLETVQVMDAAQTPEPDQGLAPEWGPEPEQVLSAVQIPEPEQGLEPEQRPVIEVDVKIPDLISIEQTADLVAEDIVIEMPEVPRNNENLRKVDRDTLRFDKAFIARVRLIIIIVIIAVVEALLIYYLLTS